MERLLASAVGALLLLSACSSGNQAASSTTSSTDGTSPTGSTAGAATDASVIPTVAPAGPDEVGVSVNGDALTVAEFDAQLASWASLAEANGQTVRTGDTYDPAFVGAITDQYIRFQAFLAALADDGTEITADDRAKAEATASTDFPGVAPDDIARSLAVGWLAGLAAIEPSADELDAYVAANAEQLKSESICSSHILVTTAEEADAVATRLADGEAFADIAKEVSIDTGSGATGGDLGCVPLGSFVPEFEQAALQAEVGVVTDPVETQFGFHLILTRDPTTEDLLPVASARISQQTDAVFTSALDAATVELAPQYGTWDQATHTYTAPVA
jgi:hypothetical protein